MDTTERRHETREPSDGVPLHVTDIAEARVKRERNQDRLQVADWWRTFVLGGALAAVGCGGGSQQPNYQATGAWMAQTESGPLQIIAIKRKDGGQ